MKQIIGIAAVLCLILTSFVVIVPSSTEAAPSAGVFRVDSDVELAAEADSGTGAWNDPWIIESRDIDAFGEGYAVYIGNTTEHFVIRGCTINQTTVAASHPYYVSAGIHLYNCRNGNISTNTVYDCETYGIFVSNESYNISVYSNTLWANKLRGVSIDYSDIVTTNYNTIYCNQTTNHAILMNGYSDHQTVAENTIHHPVFAGIVANDTWNATINDNTVTGWYTSGPDVAAGPNWAIGMYNSRWIDIEDNILRTCINGIFLTGANASESMHSTITSNDLDDCWWTGISLSFSVNITVTDNDVVDATSSLDADAPHIGMALIWYVNDTVINANTFEGYIDGVNVTTSTPTNVTIYNNYLQSNTRNGWSEATPANVAFYSGATGNWWDDWTTPDTDNDGIVDEQRDIPGTGANYDLYPRCTTTTAGGGGGGTAAPTEEEEETVPDEEPESWNFGISFLQIAAVALALIIMFAPIPLPLKKPTRWIIGGIIIIVAFVFL